MVKKNDFKGLDFQPSGKKATVSFTASDEAKYFLEYMQRRYNTNVSAFINNLILSAKKMSGNIEPMDYPFEGGKYREVTLLLRSEIADFIEAWKNYGMVGNVCINGKNSKESNPIQIGRKISYILADNVEFMSCDSNIYGVKEHVIESNFKRASEKSKEIPKSSFKEQSKPYYNI